MGSVLFAPVWFWYGIDLRLVGCVALMGWLIWFVWFAIAADFGLLVLGCYWLFDLCGF